MPRMSNFVLIAGSATLPLPLVWLQGAGGLLPSFLISLPHLPPGTHTATFLALGRDLPR